MAQIPPQRLLDRFRPQMVSLATLWRDLHAKGYRPKLTSWWRSLSKNADTSGAAAASQHLAGCAIDFTGVPLSIVQPMATRLGLTAIASQRGAVHVQALPQGTVARLLRSEPSLFT